MNKMWACIQCEAEYESEMESIECCECWRCTEYKKRIQELEAQLEDKDHDIASEKRKILDLEFNLEKVGAQLAKAHTLIHQIEDEIKYTGSEIHVRKSINNYKAAIKGEKV